jgi:ribosomal protein S18 acetylase RimI-like enzyme
MTAADYDAVFALWRVTEGMGLSEADSREGIHAYLERNPGLSLVARQGGQIIGAVLCGHDGRRGFLHHLAVALPYRGQGVGRRLVETCLAKLAAVGIQRCHLFVHVDNCAGETFWRRAGWGERAELKVYSRKTQPSTGGGQ